MLEDYRYKHLYVRNSSPIKNVGYENGLVTRLRGKKAILWLKLYVTWREKQVGKSRLFQMMKSLKKMEKIFFFYPRQYL